MRLQRTKAILLALMVACLVTVAVVDAGHGHDGMVGKACQVCHASHLPALEASLGASVPPPVFLSFHTPEAPLFHHLSPDASGGVTRAPPFSR